MKQFLTIVALAAAALCAPQVQAQTAASGSNSDSLSGSNSASGAAVNASNSGNVSAIGNENASRSASSSNSGASSGSNSGALGNNVTLNQNVPSVQMVNQTGTSTSTSTNNTNLSGQTTANENVHYSGSVSNVSTGGTVNTDNVNYSGTQTLKNVPAIAMSGPASGPCTGASGGIGLAGPGWGLGLNGSAVMVDCRIRENTRVLGMAMQSVDGAANPQEKGELLVMFMDAARSLSAYNQKIAGEEMGTGKK